MGKQIRDMPLRFAVLIVLLGSSAFGPGSAAFGQPAAADRIDLTVTSADRTLELVFEDRFEPARPLVQSSSGWPVTVVMTANEQELLGIGTPQTPPRFPERESNGYLVFADPDGCPSWLVDFFQDPESIDGCDTPPPFPFDESWVEFTPGLTAPGNEPGDRPEVFVFDFGTGANDLLLGIGPRGLTEDFNYGANPRVPGLVVVADAGPSIMTDAAFDRPDPLVCRNLAGFANSVGYELADENNRTSISVHFNVPQLLFSPVALVDRHVSTPGACDDSGQNVRGTLLRIDGGPETCIEGTPLNEIDSVVNQQDVTARFFVVNVGSREEAPDMIEDLNGNGVCDADDARMAGYELLSAEQSILFRQIHELYFGHFLDLDLDGEVGSIVAPGGAGGLTQPPR